MSFVLLGSFVACHWRRSPFPPQHPFRSLSVFYTKRNPTETGVPHVALGSVGSVLLSPTEVSSQRTKGGEQRIGPIRAAASNQEV